jgi:putative transposase
MVTCLAYCLDKELWKAIDYLKEQVRVLNEQQEKDKRVLLDDRARIRLTAKAKRLTRELLEATTVLFTPETVLGLYRRLVAQKYDGSGNCKNPARPRVSQEITDLVWKSACKRDAPRRRIGAHLRGTISVVVMSSRDHFSACLLFLTASRKR